MNIGFSPRLPVDVRPKFDFERVPSAAVALVGRPARPECEVSVAIPVYNEEAGIGATLAALAAQVDLTGEPLDPARYEVLVLANNCTDRTAAVVRQFAEARPRFQLHLIEVVLEPPFANVGGARRAVMDEAWRRLYALGRKRGVIATTDGDTLVRPDWVAATLEEVAAGADAVGGRILASPGQVAALDEGTRRYYRWDAIYFTLREAYESLLDPDVGNPWPRHQHCFGGSLAVTVGEYAEAGGMPAIQHLEDMAFRDRLYRRGARVRRSVRVKVYTSLRQAGRTTEGLSCRLSWWGEAARTGQPYLVEAPETIEQGARDRHCVRRWWESARSGAETEGVAAFLGVESWWLRDQVEGAASFFEVYEAVSQRQREQGVAGRTLPLVPVEEAVAELRARVAPHRARLRGEKDEG